MFIICEYAYTVIHIYIYVCIVSLSLSLFCTLSLSLFFSLSLHGPGVAFGPARILTQGSYSRIAVLSAPTFESSGVRRSQASATDLKKEPWKFKDLRRVAKEAYSSVSKTA